jgi:hypothetical protein
MPSPGFGQYPGEQPYLEQRTSILAILSLVFGLICFLPGPAALGLIFGICALIAIARSGDRLTGRGLAIAGVILSLIVLAVHFGAVVAATKVWSFYRTEVSAPVNQTMAAIDQGDHATARLMLTPEADKRITDADLDALRDSYQAELGRFTGIPGTVSGIFQGYAAAGPMMQPLQGRNDAFPVPANFEKGLGLVVFQFDPGFAPGGGGARPKAIPPSVNIMVIAPSGNKWTLYDPQRVPGKPGEQPAPKTESKPEPKPEAKPEAKPETKPEAKPETKPGP